MKFKIMITLASVLVSAAGCRVQDRYAPRNNVKAPALQTFGLVSSEERHQTMLNNKIFLWKKNVTAAQATLVQQAGRALDEAEDAITRIRAAAPPESDEDARRRYDDDHASEVNHHNELYASSINQILENTDCFTTQPSLVSLSLVDGNAYIVIQEWEGETYSNKANQDPQLRVRDAAYEELGGTWRFKVYNGPHSFDAGDYYDFRMSRNRLGVTDGRIYYQGDVSLVRDGQIIRRGVVKFGSSSFE